MFENDQSLRFQNTLSSERGGDRELPDHYAQATRLVKRAERSFLKNLQLEDEVREIYLQGYFAGKTATNPFQVTSIKVYCAWEAGHFDANGY